MMASSEGKQYGLIMPKKANQGLIRPRPSVFKDSDSEEEQQATDWVRKALKREAEKSIQKKQNRLDIQKALEEDPTVYQYDEVYDKIEEKKAEMSNARKQLDKKPRYIQSLLLQAEKRKREQERRNERVIQKEREAEGDEFKDKESFVTSAYRQKLEEFKKLEEEERRQDAIEALTDVSKQKDLSGFYRHLYRVTVNTESSSTSIKEEKEDKEKTDVPENSQNVENEKQEVKTKDIQDEKEDVDNNSNDTKSKDHDTSENISNTNEIKRVSRHYRKRRESVSQSDSEEDKKSKEKNESNLDADSDFSVDSDSSASNSSSSDSSTSSKHVSDSSKKSRGSRKKGKKKAKVQDSSNEKPKIEEKVNKEKDDNKGSKRKLEVEKDDDQNLNKKEKVEETKECTDNHVPEASKEKEKDKVIEKKERVPKQNIWLKRTVGEVFENALQRYYQRKADKLANKG